MLEDTMGSSLPSKQRFLLELGRPGLVVQSLHEESEFSERLAIVKKLMHLSEVPLRERLALSEACAANVWQTMQLLMWWVGGLHAEAMAEVSQESALRMQGIETIEKLRGDLRRFPSSARLVLDTFFLHW
ncbi:MAG: hypothetical protein PHT88_02445 [Candidatus Moranbacteria bacterium]|nr:hypothetical protein [Candidatus Moranbacteria bacterium]